MNFIRIFILSVSCLCVFSCASKVPTKIEIVELLPRETAIRALEVYTSGTFNTKGMISNSNELIPYENLEFAVQYMFGWNIMACKQGRYYTISGIDDCYSLLSFEQNARESTVKKVVTALKSLGVKDLSD